MPEIGEVARAVHYIHKHLVGRTLQKVTALEDANVFGKVGTSHTEIMKRLTGKKVVDAGQQGKYFWMIMSSPPHPVMHFGMAGWLRFKSEHTFYYRRKELDDDEEWPPKYWKLIFETDGKGEDKIEAAYVDLRRFGRVRLVDCPGKEIRQNSPLVENGPDPVQDKDIVTVDWLKALCHKKKVPIKAMLLDQANISGIGNWVGDEIMYNARMHPEQYCNTLSDDEIAKLHKSLHYVCTTAVDLLSDSEQFPEDWLFKHRWGKGKKDAPKTLPNGEKIVFLTVGGRTSAVVPSVQKKTGPVAKEMSDAEEDEKPAKSKKAKAVKAEPREEEEKAPKTKAVRSKRVKEEDSEEDQKPAPKRRGAKKAATAGEDPLEIPQLNGHTENPAKLPKRVKPQVDRAPETEQESKPTKKAKPSAAKPAASEENEDTGKRRSGRLKR